MTTIKHQTEHTCMAWFLYYLESLKAYYRAVYCFRKSKNGRQNTGKFLSLNRTWKGFTQTAKMILNKGL